MGSLPAPAPDAKRVLVATSDGGYLEGVTFESMLACALTLRGAEVHVLLCDRALTACHECSYDRVAGTRSLVQHGPQRLLCPGCFEAGRRAFAPLGVRIHRYSDHLSDDDRAEAAAFAADVAADEIGLVRYDGVAVGEHRAGGCAALLCPRRPSRVSATPRRSFGGISSPRCSR